ncbi:MAG: glycerate kinase, partial [Actinomycetota bacterium]|nr:glycerate kinase [Actinomycetota bacterium]
SWVLGALDVPARLAQAHAVVIGEGRLDAQSFEGKVGGELLARAREAGVPCHAIVGSVAEGLAPAGLASVSIAGNIAALEAAGRTLARLLG